MATFRALVLHEEGGKVVPRIESVDEALLPPGEVTVAVEYSTLNYKDGLILQGLGRLVRAYPHIPGIDFAGTVERSEAPEFAPGDGGRYCRTYRNARGDGPRAPWAASRRRRYPCHWCRGRRRQCRGVAVVAARAPSCCFDRPAGAAQLFDRAWCRRTDRPGDARAEAVAT